MSGIGDTTINGTNGGALGFFVETGAFRAFIGNDEIDFIRALVSEEPRCLKHCLKGMVMGEHNYARLLEVCLERGAYECLQLLLNKYTQSGCDDVNFTELIVKALTVYKSP